MEAKIYNYKRFYSQFYTMRHIVIIYTKRCKYKYYRDKRGKWGKIRADRVEGCELLWNNVNMLNKTNFSRRHGPHEQSTRLLS